MENKSAEFDSRAPAAEIVAAAEVVTQYEADKIVSKTLLQQVQSDEAIPTSVLSDLSQVLRRRAQFMLDTTLAEMEKSKLLREISRHLYESCQQAAEKQARHDPITGYLPDETPIHPN